jgi:hypothetical protein
MSPTPVMPRVQSGDFDFSMSPEKKPMSPKLDALRICQFGFVDS